VRFNLGLENVVGGGRKKQKKKKFSRKTVLIMKIWIMVDLALVIVCWASV
tara:strand:+ start:203 stop:352 length:150 start_codon:yes stop_codon:yes gene_type:complete